jgi:cytochrome c oxidase assembly factor CtaG
MVQLHLGHKHLPIANSFTDFLQYWEEDPFVLLSLLIFGLFYFIGKLKLEGRSKRRVVENSSIITFGGGLLALTLALLSPISVYAEDLFFMHMLQHILLVMVAAPLLLLANPMKTLIWAFPKVIRKFMGRRLKSQGLIRKMLALSVMPLFAWFIFAVCIWLWHSPSAYNAALENEAVHVLEHMTIFIASVILWWSVIGPAPVRTYLPYPLRCLYILAALVQNTILGAMLTFAEAPLYSYYGNAPAHWGITTDYDQQLGGIIMWIPGGMMYLAALIILFFIWIRREDSHVKLSL